MTGNVFGTTTVGGRLNCVDLSVAATVVLSDSELDSLGVIAVYGNATVSS